MGWLLPALAGSFDFLGVRSRARFATFPEEIEKPRRMRGRGNNCQNAPGTQPGRGLRRIQGRQARR